MKKSIKIIASSLLFTLFGVFSLKVIEEHDYIEKIPTKYLLNGVLDNGYREDTDNFDYYLISNTDENYDGKYAVSLKEGVDGGSYTIPSTYNNKDVIGIYRSGFAKKNKISVTLPTTLKVIDYEAFFCTSFSSTSLDIPYTVEKMGTAAFFKTNIESLAFLDTDNPSSLGVCSTDDSDTSEEETSTSSQLSEIPDFCFAKCSSLKSITFSNSLVTIKEEAFEYCSGLTTVAFLGGLKKIGERAFNACSDLKEVYLPSSLFTKTSDAFDGSIGNYAFANCNTKLGFQASTDKSTYQSFQSSFPLFDRMSDFSTSKYGCEYTSGDIYANGTWLYERTDTGINILKYIGNLNSDGIMAFPDTIYTEGQSHKVTTIDTNCISEYADQIKKVYFPKFLTEIPDEFFTKDYKNVTYIGSMSGTNCYNISSETLTIDLSAMDDLTTIGESSFALKNKDKFTKLMLPKGLKEVKQDAFNGFKSVQTFSIATRDTFDTLSIGKQAFQYLGSKSSVQATADIELPKGTNSIGEKTFDGASCIRSLTIKGNPSVASSDAQELKIEDNAFRNCKNLRKVIIEDRKISTGYKAVTLFEKCFSMDDLDYSPNPLLQTVYLPNGVTTKDSKKDIFNGQYRAVIYYGGTSTLDLSASLVFNERTNSSKTDYLYSNSVAATKFNFNCEMPTYTGVTLSEYVVATSSSILYDTADFVYLLNPSNLTACLTKYHFDATDTSQYTNNKKTVNVSEKVNFANTDYTITEIGKYAFAHSDSYTPKNDAVSNPYTISSVTLPSSIQKIGDYAFFRCVGLERAFAMPSSLKSIGYLAFAFTGISSITDLNSDCSFTENDLSIQTDYSKPSPFLNCPNLSSITLTNKDSSTLMLSNNSNALLDSSNHVWVLFPGYTGTNKKFSFSSTTSKFHFGAFKTVGWIEELTISGSNYSTDSNGNVIAQTLFTGYCTQNNIRLNLKMGTLVSDLVNSATPLESNFNNSSMVLKLKLDESGNLTIPDGAFLKSNIKTIRIPYGKGNGVIPRNFLTGITVPTAGLVLQVETNEEGTAWTNAEEKTGVLDFGSATKNDANYTGYTKISDQAFYNSSFLKEVNLGSIETVGKMAFYQNTNLTTITCPNVTTISDQAFYNDTNLTTLECPKATYIGKNSFQNCNRLTKAYCPAATTIDDYAFQSCIALSDLTISSAMKLGIYAFNGTTKLQYLKLPNTLTQIGNNCFEGSTIKSDSSNSTIFTIPKSVNALGTRAFRECDNLVNVVFESGSVLDSISDSCFDNCSNLSQVTLPENLTSINQVAFWGCAFTELEFPSSIQNIGWRAFDHGPTNWGDNNRSKLQSIIFKGSTNKLTIGSEAFRYSEALKSIIFEECSSDLEIGSSAFEQCTSLTALTLPDRGTITLNNYVFNGCTKLASVLIEKSSNNITINKYCFNNCTSLKTLTLNDRPEIQLKDYAFNNCSSLSIINVPLSTGELHIHEGCFSKCTGLTALTFENRSKISVGNNAFEHCTSLRSVTINDVDVKFWSNVFNGCSSLSTITINKSQTNTPVYFSTSVFASCPITTLDFSKRPVWLGKLVNMNAAANVVDSNISWGAGKIFEGCTSLTSVIFGDFDNGNYIGEGVFSGCTSLSNVTWGSSITNIGKDAFKSTKLTSVDLSKCTNASFTALNGFSDCTSLTSFIYPSQITSIGESCFNGSTSLKIVSSSSSGTNGVYLSSSISSIGNSAFFNCRTITIVKSECAGALSLGASAFSNCTSLKIFSQDTSGSLTYGENVFSSDSALMYIVLPSNFDTNTSNFMLVGGLSQFSSTGTAYICFANGKIYFDFSGDNPTWVKINTSGSYIAKLAYYSGNGRESSGTYYEWSWTDTNRTDISVETKTVSSTSSNSIRLFGFLSTKKEERLSL